MSSESVVSPIVLAIVYCASPPGILPGFLPLLVNTPFRKRSPSDLLLSSNNLPNVIRPQFPDLSWSSFPSGLHYLNDGLGGVRFRCRFQPALKISLRFRIRRFGLYRFTPQYVVVSLYLITLWTDRVIPFPKLVKHVIIGFKA